MGKPLAERFWAKVDKRGPDECWPWTGHHCHGYGIIWDGRNRRATHVAWEFARGKPPPIGKMICHSCDNPICVNAAHLWIGTAGGNLHDAIKKGRRKPLNSKLDAAKAARIRQLWSDGIFSQKELGRRYGVNKATIHKITSGKIWRGE